MTYDSNYIVSAVHDLKFGCNTIHLLQSLLHTGTNGVEHSGNWRPRNLPVKACERRVLAPEELSKKETNSDKSCPSWRHVLVFNRKCGAGPLRTGKAAVSDAAWVGS